jgi:hypothetical protein
MGRTLQDLDDLNSLETGDEIDFTYKTIRVPQYSNFKETENFYKPHKSVFCWNDTYKDKEIKIFAKHSDSQDIVSEILPLEWFKIEKGKGFVVERYRNERGPGKANSTSFELGTREYRLLSRALSGQPPSQEGIEKFRNCEMYLNFFGTTPIKEMMIKEQRKDK